MEKAKKIVSSEQIQKILDSIYDMSINGIPKVSPNINEFAENYLEKDKNPEKAAKKMIKNQLVKCTTSGFLSGLGGIITLPVSVPANITSVLYVQMRMIACCAYLAGYDTHSDQVQTLVYACLAGVSVNSVIKNVGKQFGIKVANGLVDKIPGKALISINKKVSFRFITKAGKTGLINIKNLVPGVGGILGGAFDFTETKVIANRAYRWFFEGDMSGDEEDLPLFLFYHNCSTCKKARTWLMENDIEFRHRDIIGKKPSKKELKEWIKTADVDIKKWFNTSGMMYKELNLKEKLPNMNLEEKIKLLSSDGSLIKRPIIISSNGILIGFNEEEWKSFFIENKKME